VSPALGLQLVECYEEVRGAQAADGGAVGRGLTLLLRRGVVAWMRGWGSLGSGFTRDQGGMSGDGQASDGRSGATESVASSVSREVISLMAGIALRRLENTGEEA
jgi:hypothetical protein